MRVRQEHKQHNAKYQTAYANKIKQQFGSY
jgi:hypothetical protein